MQRAGSINECHWLTALLLSGSPASGIPRHPVTVTVTRQSSHRAPPIAVNSRDFLRGKRQAGASRLVYGGAWGWGVALRARPLSSFLRKKQKSWHLKDSKVLLFTVCSAVLLSVVLC
jgi:hypothetical protein